MEMTRRSFLKAGTAVVAASIGQKCINKLVSTIEPEPLGEPGKVSLIATTCRECPAGCGMHAWHRDGRIVKVEGNPEHPINRGRLCARG